MSATINIHATGSFTRVSFKAEPLVPEEPNGTLMLRIRHESDQEVIVFLSQDTAKACAAALAGYLHLELCDGSDHAIQGMAQENHDALLDIARAIPHSIIEEV